MDAEYYLVSPMLKALVSVGKRVKGEARKAIGEIWKRDKEAHVCRVSDDEYMLLENAGYSVVESW